MHTMTARVLRTSGALLFACALFVPTGAAHAQTLDEIIEASLEATGGRDALARITSVRQTGTHTMSITGLGDLDGDTEIVIVPNQKLYQSLDNEMIQQTGAWNGAIGWQSDNMQGTVDVDVLQADLLAYQTMLHPFLPYNTPELGTVEFSKLDDTEIGGRPHHVVGVSTGVVDYEMSVDVETKMVSQVRFETEAPGVGPMTITAGFSDFQEYGGVMFTTKGTFDMFGAIAIETRYTAVELNGEVDHSIFEKP